ncbi:MAG: inositol monophosphatase [Rhodobacteraceae bacterium]|nr:inositol monophosphatase [Paracoccaceae bacterium]
MTTHENVHAERLEFASTLARQVGQYALKYWEQHGSENLGTTSKGLQDFVTIADKVAEDTIRNMLSEHFPEDGFVGEESGGERGEGGYWVVDPIDGTANYLRGLRHWGVSIAYVENGKTVLGVIHDSPTDRIYAATLGGGATRNGVPIFVAATINPHSAMGIIGASRRTSIDLYLAQLRALHDAGIEHRKIGAATIGIVRVAEGVADFYYEKHLNCWDALAALLIASEAGAQVVAPNLEEFVPNGGEVFCGVPSLSPQLEGLLLAV